MTNEALKPLTSTQSSTDLADLHNQNSVFACWKGRTITRGEFYFHVRQLSRKLPAGRYALNLCEDKYLFSVSFLALLIRGQINLLPPNKTEKVLQEIVSQHRAAYCIVDQPDPKYPIQSFIVSNTFMGNKPAEPPLIHSHEIAAINYTSGSTGIPKATATTWGAFRQSADLALHQLNLMDKTTVVVSTVPPQHMYGLESSLFWPISSTLSVCMERPFFPEDIRRVMASMSEPCLLVSTPTHLNACIQADLNWSNINAVLSSTSPLSPDLAKRIEQELKAPLYEIFGSTETLSFASRRPSQQSSWTPYPDLAVFSHNGKNFLKTHYFDRPLPLDDILEIGPNGQFHVTGRATDLIKVAGKRTSLVELNQRLIQIEGVDDGIFFVSTDQLTTGRLGALVVTQVSKSAILDELRRSIDEVFLPRPIYNVGAIPRNSMGKIMQSAMANLLKELSGGK